MKSRFIPFLTVSILTLGTLSVKGQLLIEDFPGATALAQQLVGAGVTISNVTFTGNPAMAGIFENKGGTKIGIGSGIVLTSGRARTNGGTGVNGNGTTPASNTLADNGWGLPGDPDLGIEIGSSSLRDACILEFDFIPLGDSIRFNYVFSSEEYVSQYVCSFNDAFAFFISGPGFTGQKNIALVPNTSIPVSIFNVNDVPGGACPNNQAYFLDNSTNTQFTHDGLTTTLVAHEKVRPCEVYHLKLVIADVIDDAFDSGVFLEARSLSSNVIGMSNLTQIDPAGNSYLVEGCVPGSFTIKRPRKDPTALTVMLTYEGTAVNGIDYQLMPDQVTIPSNDDMVTVNIIPIVDNTSEGVETILVKALAGCATGLPSATTTIEIRDYDALVIVPQAADVCRNAPVQLTASPGYSVYQWDADPTLSDPSIANPVAIPSSPITTYIATATLGSCNAKDSVILRTKMVELLSTTNVNCKDGNTGAFMISGSSIWQTPVQFSIDGVNWQPAGSFSNLPAGSYWAKIKDAGCIDSVQVNIIQAFADLIADNSIISAASCTGGADGTITLSATGGKSPYTFSLDGNTFQSAGIFNVVPGDYSLTIRDANGCEAFTTATVALNNTVTLEAGQDVTICNGTSFKMESVSNSADLLWTPSASLDDPTLLTPTASPSDTTKYYITATTGVCIRLDSIQVNIRPAPIANAGADIDVCFGKVFEMSGSGGVEYLWSPSVGLTTAADIANPSAKAKQNITYHLAVKDMFGCSSLQKDEVSVTVTPVVKLTAGSDTIAAIGQPIQLHAKDRNNAGVTTYIWTPAGFLDDPTIANPVAILLQDQRFMITAATPEGCEGIDDILIKVYKGPDIYVPSGFTPDNNGLNDILKPIAVGIKELKFFRVFNRNGQMVFFTQQYSHGWDGRIKGVAQSTGTYVWMAEGIDYTGKTVIRKGVTTLIR